MLQRLFRLLLLHVFLCLRKLVEAKLVLVHDDRLALLVFVGFGWGLEQLGRLCLEQLLVGPLIFGALAS
jgi:hypothetical protein